MENKYFTRKINEGEVKRSHVCSFDSSIKLELRRSGSKKVIDYLIRSQAIDDKKTSPEKEARENFIRSISELYINGLPIIIEDLETSFDSEEILEVIAFVNGGDMSIFGGSSEVEKND